MEKSFVIYPISKIIFIYILCILRIIFKCKYKYSSSSAKKIKLTEEEEEILKNFSKGANRKIKSYALWRDKVIESGKYIDILKEEKERLKKLERQKAKEVITPPENFEKSTPEEDKAGLELLRETAKQIRKRKTEP